MLLSFTRVVFLIVHYCLLSIIAALPVTQTSTTAATQTHETDNPKQTRTPLEVNTFKFATAEHHQQQQTIDSNSKEILLSRAVAAEEEEEEAEDDGDDRKYGRTGKDKKFRACRVANLTYQHREQIPRSDPCEMCVCVDSEIYCLWKLCTFFKPTTTTAPLPKATSSNSQPTTKQSAYDNKSISDDETEEEDDDERANEIETTNEKYSKILMDRRKYNVLKKLQTTTARAASTTTSSSTSRATETTKTTTTTTTTTAAVTTVTTPKTSSTTAKSNSPKPSTTTTQPVVCYVMGVMYKYGEVLPRDTGTCLECSCSEGGRVTCSPKDCVSQPDLDYLSHNNNLDMFDLDTF